MAEGVLNICENSQRETERERDREREKVEEREREREGEGWIRDQKRYRTDEK